ncbi:hypothetical protein KKF84_06855, partial [Myxococcota bacterium]|nr:hypothetical protein [Myxococcota bacterium]MBU1535020.1 hypothetical protein [Myxococcota bacterium]
MELPREIVESLTVCTPGDIIAWHELKSGMESKWGQTYLMLTGSLFFAMTHTSFTDPWTVVKLDPSGPNEIQLLRYEETLLVRDFQGRQYAVQVYDLEREELVAFLDTLSKHRDGLELPALQPPQQPEEPAPQSYAPDPSPQKVAAQDNAPDNAPDSGTIEEVLDDLDALPLDPSTEFVMNKLERLIDKGNEYLQFGTENDPIERLS